MWKIFDNSNNYVSLIIIYTVLKLNEFLSASSSDKEKPK